MKKDGWKYKKLGEVANIINGRNQKKVLSSDGPYPICGSGGIIGYANDYLCPEDSVIIGRKGNINNPIFMDTKFWNVDTAFGIAPLKEFLLPKFLYYFCIIFNFEKYNKAVTIPSLTKSDLKQIVFPVPPLPIQHQIVSHLDKLNEIIDKQRELLKVLDKLEQSIFYEMFGDPVKNEKGWEKKKLIDISYEIGDGLHGTPTYDENGDCYFINGNNLNRGKIVFTDTTLKVNDVERDKYYIQFGENTIFVSINGTVGKLSYYDNENIILGKSACYINLNESVDKHYIYSLLNSDYFMKYALGEATGSTIKNVSLKTMRNFSFPLPPLSLQQSFASRITHIEQQKQAIQSSIDKFQEMLDGAMDEYFGDD